MKCLRDRGLGERERDLALTCIPSPAGILLQNAFEACLSPWRAVERSQCQYSVIPRKASLSPHKAMCLTHVRGPGLAQPHTAEEEQ